MRNVSILRHMLALLAVTLCFASCKKYDDEIDALNTRVGNLENRVDKLEEQAKQTNTQISQIAVLASAVENGMYISNVTKTENGYELILSNGQKLTLTNGKDGSNGQDALAPAIGVTLIDGVYYWTLNGEVMRDANGNMVRASGADGHSPKVMIDPVTLEWLIATDGVNYEHTNVFAQVEVNEAVLQTIINNYVTQHQNTIISNEVLFQIITTYIENNYSVLFNTEILNTVVKNHVENNISTIISNTMLSQLITTYIEQNSSTVINNELLTKIIMNFIENNSTTLIGNEIIGQIILAYVEQNQTNIFDVDIMKQVITAYVQNNITTIIDADLLSVVIKNYIEENHSTVITNTLLAEIIGNYVEVNLYRFISSDMLYQIFTDYLSVNVNVIITEALLKEVISTYVSNHYATFISNQAIYDIINNYVSNNVTNVINADLLYQVISVYFRNNYNTIVDQDILRVLIANYIEVNQTNIISVDIVQAIVTAYVQKNITTIITNEMLANIITTYFSQNTTIVQNIVNDNSLIKDISISSDKAEFTLRNQQKLSLVVYDAYARVRDRVQSIVYVPDYTDGQVTIDSEGMTELTYAVMPASMAQVIATGYANKSISVQLVTKELKTRTPGFTLTSVTASNGELKVKARASGLDDVDGAAVALQVKDNKAEGTNYMTTFTTIYGLYHSNVADNYTFKLTSNYGEAAAQTTTVNAVNNFMRVILKEGTKGCLSVTDEKGEVPDFSIMGGGQSNLYSIYRGEDATGRKVVFIESWAGAMLVSPNFTLNILGGNGEVLTSFTIAVNFNN